MMLRAALAAAIMQMLLTPPHSTPIIVLAQQAVAHAHQPLIMDRGLARISTSAMHLQRYHATGDIAELRQAVELMDGTIDTNTWTPSNFIEKRRVLVRQWAALVATIQDAYPRGFDPKNTYDLPSSCVVPPGDGTLLCGAKPDNVKDPKLRAEYVAEIRANQRKYQIAMQYRDVDLLNMRAMTQFTGSLRFLNSVAPCSATRDFATLDSIVRAAGVRGERLSRIEAAMYQTLKTNTASP